MRTIADNEIAAQVPVILDAVRRGETVVVTQNGRPVANIVPNEDERRERMRAALRMIEDVRHSMPKMTIDEILEAIREERR